MKRFGTAALFAAAAVVLASAATASADPPTLSGEVFTLSPVAITATCPDSSASSFMFSAAGVATGPYPGSFTETGTVTMSNVADGFVDGIPLFEVATVQASFTVDSPVGEVTGSKQLVVPDFSINGGCLDFVKLALPDQVTVLTGTFRRISPSSTGFGLAYDATIVAPDSSRWEDVGSAGLLIDQLQATAISGSVGNSDAFNEAFSSAGTSVARLFGTGHVTGGGQLASRVTFGFDADSDGGLHGVCTVLDQLAGVKLKCLDMTSYSQTGVHATFSGHATVNGVATSYRIDTYDNAEPGRGADAFAISTGSGYSAGGTLSQGNIQLHG